MTNPNGKDFRHTAETKKFLSEQNRGGHFVVNGKGERKFIRAGQPIPAGYVYTRALRGKANVVRINVKAHRMQRYDTVGDWFFTTRRNLVVHVSDMQNEKYHFLVGLHEYIEAMLCHFRDIKEQDVTDFDLAFEAQRPAGNTDEPGDSPLAPYNKEHQFATKIERMVAEELGVSWDDYDKTVNSLGEEE